MRILKGLLLLPFLLAAPCAASDPVTIALPPEMTETGFATHLLPRFKFRHQIAIQAVAPNASADLALRAGPDQGEAILQGRDGTVYHLSFAADSEAGRKFSAWLRSAPGRKALESFPRGGPPLFVLFDIPAEITTHTTPSGDSALGAQLALTHCGRCHVVDERNRMGGIGSTPSFGALRARENWHDLFLKFWTEPPHPTFTLIPGMTEEFTAARPARIHPVKLSDNEVDAIIAFIATMKPKDLGAPLRYD